MDVNPEMNSVSLRSSRPIPERDQNLARLRKVAQDFEAVFLRSLMRSMRNTVPESGLIDDRGAIKYYNQMFDEELANATAHAGTGLGVADLVYQQFEKLYAESAASEDAPGDRKRLFGQAPVPTAGLAHYQRQAASDQLAERMAELKALAPKLGTSTADSLVRYKREIRNAAQESDVDPGLLLAVMMEESGGDVRARSPQGAMGLMQLMPETAKEVGVRRPWRASENLQGGARYLARMLAYFNDRLDLALAAYNAGPGSVKRAGDQIPPYAETQRYVRRVQDRYQALCGHDVPAAGPTATP